MELYIHAILLNGVVLRSRRKCYLRFYCVYFYADNFKTSDLLDWKHCIVYMFNVTWHRVRTITSQLPFVSTDSILWGVSPASNQRRICKQSCCIQWKLWSSHVWGAKHL